MTIVTTVGNLSEGLLNLIEQYGLDTYEFVQFATPENFRQDQLDDLSYMEDKINIYTEDSYEDCDEFDMDPMMSPGGYCQI